MERIPLDRPLDQIRWRRGVYLLQARHHPGQFRIGSSGCGDRRANKGDEDIEDGSFRVALAKRLGSLAGAPNTRTVTDELKPWDRIWAFGFDHFDKTDEAKKILQRWLREAYTFGDVPGRKLIFESNDPIERICDAAIASEPEIRKKLAPGRKGLFG